MVLKKLSAALLVCAILPSVALAAKPTPIEKAQQLRQAPMKLIANNFGFMNAMMKGKVDWNDGEFLARGRELGAMGQLDLMRGYLEDSYEGKTRAKPDVDLDREDFESKMDKFESQLQGIGQAANRHKVDVLKNKVKELGKSCKSCHKKYKSKEYQN